MQSDELTQLGKALGRIPSGMFIVAYRNLSLGEPDGMLMSWIQQISFDPPLLMVAVKKDRPVLASLNQGALIAINVLPKEGGGQFLSVFFKSPPGMTRFQEADYELSPRSALPVLKFGVAHLDCEIIDVVSTPGDHCLLIVQAMESSPIISCDFEPKIHLRKSGFNY